MKNASSIATTIAALVFPAMTASAADYEYTSRQSNLGQIGVTEALHETVNGDGFGIAIFDSLADYTHVDLTGKTQAFAPYAGSYRYFDFHGTHVSGIAGGAANDLGIVGVAPGASLYNYAFFDDNGWVANDLGRRALNAVRSQNLSGANIVSVNMSYGPTARGDAFITGELEIFDDYKNDFVIVRAAGNDGRKLGYERYSGTASRDLSHLLIVGSVDSNNSLSSFSNSAGAACIAARTRCTKTEKMFNFFVVAPGSDILSDYPGQSLATASGTSMAAPHVAGVVALVAHDAANKNVDLTPTDIASIIKETATDLGRRGLDAVYGWGLVNVDAALAPIGAPVIETAPVVSTPAKKQPFVKKKPKRKKKAGRGRAGGRRSFSQSTIATGDLLSGMVVFDDYGRPFEANTAAFVGEDSTVLSERGLAVLGLVSQRKVADIDTGEHALLAWNATGLDGKATSALRMVAEDYELNIGLGAPELFLMDVPSANRAAAPQTFSRIMFSSLGEASELFGEAVSIGYNAKLTDRLTGHVFGMTETGFMDEVEGGPAMLEAAPETPGDADFAAAGLSYHVAEGWSVGGSYAVLRERGTVAGIASSGALSLGEEALTQFWGANVTGAIDKTLSLSAFYTRAVINSSGTENSLFDAANDWGADHYGVMLDAKNVVHDNSVLRFSLVKPFQITSGTTSVRVPVGRELDGTINYVRRESEFDGSALPIEMGVAYLAETGAGTFGLTLDLVDTNLNGAGEQGVTVGAGFSFDF